MIIRAAAGQDARAIAQANVLSWQHAYRAILPADFLAGLSVERRQAYWGKAIVNSPLQVLVADDSGEIVGFSAFGPCRDDNAAATDYASHLSPGGPVPRRRVHTFGHCGYHTRTATRASR